MAVRRGMDACDSYELGEVFVKIPGKKGQMIDMKSIAESLK